MTRFQDGPPRSPEAPVPGFYSVRLVRKGPPVAARIDFKDGMWAVSIDGKPPAHAPSEQPWTDPAMERVAMYGMPIPEAEYHYLLARAAHAREHDPTHPAANPEMPINLIDMKPIF